MGKHQRQKMILCGNNHEQFYVIGSSNIPYMRNPKYILITEQRKKAKSRNSRTQGGTHFGEE